MQQKQYISSNDDKCACQCFPNGIIATIVVNVLLWTAVVFSGGAAVDCHVVQANIMPTTTAAWPALPTTLVGLTDGQPADRRGFGFFIHEDDNGDCR